MKRRLCCLGVPAVVAVIGTVVGLAASTARADLVAYWEFEPGALTVDSSLNGHTLANSGVDESTDAAVGAGSAYFDGSALLQTVESLDLSKYKSITISWRQKLTGAGIVFEHTPNCMAWVGNEEGGFYGWGDPTGYSEAALRGGPSALAPSCYLDTYNGTPDAGWVAMSVTFEPAAANASDVIRSTKNGASIGSDLYTNSLPSAFANNILFIGGRGEGGVYKIQGQLDDLKIVGTVPEPATLLMSLSGLIGLLAYAWRRGR